MGLFDKLKGPVFLKETSDAKEQLEQLKEFYTSAPNEIKERVEQDINMLSYGINGEDNVAFELKNSFMPMVVLIRELKRKGIAVIILAVNISDTLSIADRFLVIEHGSIVKDFPKEEFSSIRSIV